MCSSGDCNLTWQNGPAQWANYILGIKFNILKEFRYPNPKVRCGGHDKTAGINRCNSSNRFLKDQFFFTCVNKKEDGGKCEFVKAAQFPSDSINAKNLEAWYKIEVVRQAKDNKAAKAGLSHHLQEVKRSMTAGKKKV